MREAPSPLPPDSGGRRGLVQRYMAWTDGLSGRGWWVPVGLLAAILAWGHAVLWVTGRLPPGKIDTTFVILSVYGPYELLAMSYGRWTAQRSLIAFWPATGWPSQDRGRWAEAFDSVPSGVGWIVILSGLAGGIGSLLLAPADLLGPEEGRLALYIAYAPAFILGYGVVPIWAGLGLRWLGLVARIHREATAINPFDDGPIFAFSRLTVASGLSFLLVVYYSFTANGVVQAGNVISLLFLGISVIFGVVVFVAPLWGIHDRLVREKELRMVDIERRLDRLTGELYARVDSGSLEGSDRINAAVNAASALRERIARLPTWPWPPQLLRGFVTALLLPVIVYIVTRLITVQIGA